MENNHYIIVTGANGGMGSALTEAFARTGAGVIMACRNMDKSKPVHDDIVKRTGNRNIHLFGLDLSSFPSVCRFADDLKKSGMQCDALINNAGIMSPDYRLTADGFEMDMGVNYLGTLLLTRCLLPLMNKGGKIINTCSCTYRIGSLNKDIFCPSPKNYLRLVKYGTSKLALLLYTMQLARELKPEQIYVNAVDPGIVDTGIITMGSWVDPLADILFRPFISTPREAIERTVTLLSGENVTGKYWNNSHEIRIPDKIVNHPLREWLWNETNHILSPFL